MLESAEADLELIALGQRFLLSGAVEERIALALTDPVRFAAGKSHHSGEYIGYT